MTLGFGSFQDLSDRCDLLQTAHNTLVNFTQDKMRLKSLGKDGLAKMHTSLRTTAAMLMTHCMVNQVTYLF